MNDRPIRTDTPTTPSPRPSEQSAKPSPELQQKLDVIRTQRQAKQDAKQPGEQRTADAEASPAPASNENAELRQQRTERPWGRASENENKVRRDGPIPQQRATGDTIPAQPSIDHPSTKLQNREKSLAAQNGVNAEATSRKSNELVKPDAIDPRLIKVPKPDAAADALAERIRGVSRVKFANDPKGREFDAVSKDYIAQSKPANFQVGKDFRNQARATFERALQEDKIPYFHFEGMPRPGVLEKLAEYSERYNVEPVIDIGPLEQSGELNV